MGCSSAPLSQRPSWVLSSSMIGCSIDFVGTKTGCRRSPDRAAVSTHRPGSLTSLPCRGRSVAPPRGGNGEFPRDHARLQAVVVRLPPFLGLGNSNHGSQKPLPKCLNRRPP